MRYILSILIILCSLFGNAQTPTLLAGNINITTFPVSLGGNKFQVVGTYSDITGKTFASDVTKGMWMLKNNDLFYIDSIYNVNGSILTYSVIDTFNIGIITSGTGAIVEVSDNFKIPGIPVTGDSNPSLIPPGDYSSLLNYIITKIDTALNYVANSALADGNGIYSGSDTLSELGMTRVYISGNQGLMIGIIPDTINPLYVTAGNGFMINNDYTMSNHSYTDGFETYNSKITHVSNGLYYSANSIIGSDIDTATFYVGPSSFGYTQDRGQKKATISAGIITDGPSIYSRVQSTNSIYSDQSFKETSSGIEFAISQARTGTPYNWIKIKSNKSLTDSTGNNVSFYNGKIVLPNQQPTITNGVKTYLTFTGNGSTAVPAIETIPQANAGVVYDAGNGAWVRASAAGVTFTRTNLTTGTFTIPDGVDLYGGSIHHTSAQNPGAVYYVQYNFQGTRTTNTTMDNLMPPDVRVANKYLAVVNGSVSRTAPITYNRVGGTITLTTKVTGIGPLEIKLENYNDSNVGGAYDSVIIFQF